LMLLLCRCAYCVAGSVPIAMDESVRCWVVCKRLLVMIGTWVVMWRGLR
jgi:hypothetical protein